MKLLKREPQAQSPKTRPLGPDLSFLDVIADACARGGRFTITADSSAGQFIVLVDRGGAFNAAGAGTTGTPALEAAATLRTGMYTIRNGWPMEQPLYQIGLDKALHRLLGHEPGEEDTLPEARGVDALREGGTASVAGVVAPATPPPAAPALVVNAVSTTPTVPMAPPTHATFAWPGSMPDGPAASPLQARAAATPVPAPLPPAPAPPAMSAQVSDHPVFRAAQPVAPAAARPNAVPLPAASAFAPDTPGAALVPTNTRADRQPPSYYAERALMDSLRSSDTKEADPTAPGLSGASQAQGGLKHLLTQAILWLVHVEGDSTRYTLAQAMGLVRIALGDYYQELRANVRHFYYRVVRHQVDRVKEDWRKSGVAAAKKRPPAPTPTDELWDQRIG